METQIIETKLNYFLRCFAKGICIFILLIGIIFIIMQLFIKDYFVLGLGILFIALGSYFLKSFVRINKIKDDSILLESGKKEIELFHNQINYLFKFVPYSITSRYGILISSNRKGINKFLIIFNDPQLDLLTIMKNSGVKVKNIG